MRDKINSFRWSRLTSISAWERLDSCWGYLFFVFCFVCAFGFFHPVLLVSGIVLIILFALCKVCCADGYVKIDNREYYIYKNNNLAEPYTIIEEENWPKLCYDEIFAKKYEIVPLSCKKKCLLYQDIDDCWYLIAEEDKMFVGYKKRKLGKRLAKSFFIDDVDDVKGKSADSVKVLTVFCKNEKVRRYFVRKVFIDKDVKPLFTKQEQSSLSKEELLANYVLAKISPDCATLWMMPISDNGVFSACKIKRLPIEHMLVRDGKDVKLYSRNNKQDTCYHVSHCFDLIAIGLSGRFLEILSNGRVVIYEFDPNSCEQKEIYRGRISAMDFVTGEFEI